MAKIRLVSARVSRISSSSAFFAISCRAISRNRDAAVDRVDLNHIQMVGDEIMGLWNPVLLVANDL